MTSVSDFYVKIFAGGVSGLSVVETDWLFGGNEWLLSGRLGDEPPKLSGVLCVLAGLHLSPPFLHVVLCIKVCCLVLYHGNSRICRVYCVQPTSLLSEVSGLVRKPTRSVARAACWDVVFGRPQKYLAEISLSNSTGGFIWFICDPLFSLRCKFVPPSPPYISQGAIVY